MGIDYSTKDVHVVTVNDSGIPMQLVSAKFPGPTSFDRLRPVRSVFVVLTSDLRWDRFSVVGIEDPRATNPKLRSMIAKLARVQGAIIQGVPVTEHVVPLNAAQWRKKIGLPGNCPKAVVAEWAVARGMPRDVDQDYYDAFAIARAALADLSSDVRRSETSDVDLD